MKEDKSLFGRVIISQPGGILYGTYLEVEYEYRFFEIINALFTEATADYFAEFSTEKGKRYIGRDFLLRSVVYYELKTI